MTIVKENKLIVGYESLFLDALRLSASILVFIFHSFLIVYPTSYFAVHLSDWAHCAVVVFFVLSGYVISYTNAINNRGAAQYAIARLSRLWSVVIPSLVITGILEAIVFFNNEAFYEGYHRGSPFLRYILSASFLNEIWFLSAAPPFNIPLWSLSFEFWYYAAFGAWIYFTNNKKVRITLIVLIALIAGPKIFLLFPLWIFGFVAYRLNSINIRKQGASSWVIVFFMLIAVGVLVSYLPDMPFRRGLRPLFLASSFISDWIVGLCVGFMLWNLPLKHKSEIGIHTPKFTAFRKIADLTFPIYLLHYPMIIFYKSFIMIENKTAFIIMLLAVLTSCCLMGLLMERYRYWWSDALTTFQNKMKPNSININTVSK
jgi:peptidoglycan/LPS O-acetylase OafA/YrhL